MAKELMSMLTDPLFWALLVGVFAAFALMVRSQIRCLRLEQAAEREWRVRQCDQQVRGFMALRNAARLVKESEAGAFVPPGPVVDIGPDYIVTRGADGGEVTTYTGAPKK